MKADTQGRHDLGYSSYTAWSKKNFKNETRSSLEGYNYVDADNAWFFIANNTFIPYNVFIVIALGKSDGKEWEVQNIGISFYPNLYFHFVCDYT